MAGAGKKTFIAGEVLTAAQVNDYLMDQAVMRFSGSAARAASITAPTEGMVTYLDDVNRLEIYDGSAWLRVAMRSEDVRNLITASSQVLIGTASGSLAAITASADGQVLTANSALPGGLTWQAPAGAGQAAWANVTTASTNTRLSSSLDAGFYKISTSGTTTYTSAEFRFVDTSGNFYGASLAGGNGFFTIPTAVASVNLTTGTPVTMLVEEVPGITSTLQAAPSASLRDFTEVQVASITTTAPAGATLVGFFQTNTGSLVTMPTSGGAASFISALSASPSLGTDVDLKVVARDSQGIWTTATPVSRKYPYVVYRSNATFTMPPWSNGSVDVRVVAGGGGGSGRVYTPIPLNLRSSGGGGAGGLAASVVAVTGSVAVTVGGGGAGTSAAAGGDGGASSFGAISTTGGGGGGLWPNGNGRPGGSGGGGGGGGSSTGGTGIAGQGFPGGGFAPNGQGATGGGSASAGSPAAALGNTTPGGLGTVAFGLALAFGGDNMGTAATSIGGGGGGNRATPTYGLLPGAPGAAGAVIVKVRQ